MSASSDEMASLNPTAWPGLALRDRLKIIRRFRNLLATRAEDFIAALKNANRPHDIESIAGELIPLADACAFLERRAEKILRSRREGSRGRPLWLFGVTATVHHVPLGRILVIGPGNYPLMLPGIQIVQALAAGNTVAFKPAPGTSASALLLCETLHDAGVPRNALTLLSEDPASVQRELPTIDKVVFTGSARTGSKVLAMLADRAIPSAMELSGCDAAFVLDGADLNLASKAIAFGLMFNGSQTCMAPRRVFVMNSVADEFVVKLLKAVDASPGFVGTKTATQASHLHLDAIAQGAKLVLGDLSSSGPLIFDHASADMQLLKEDIFAPVQSIVRVSSADEAIQAHAKCPYRLSATVFGPVNEATAFAARIDVGNISVNDMLAPSTDPRLPFGGNLRSGFGVTRGVEGLLEMTRPKVISVRRGGVALHLRPDAHKSLPLLLAYFKAINSAGVGARLKNWINVVREGRTIGLTTETRRHGEDKAEIL